MKSIDSILFYRPAIHKAIREVRENNKNSLSGLSIETILDRVFSQLKGHNAHGNKTPIAPWANLTQTTKGLRKGKFEGIGEDQCSICLEQLGAVENPPMTLPCQHVFHMNCIKPWLKQKSDCPICRSFTLMNDEYPSLPHN